MASVIFINCSRFPFVDRIMTRLKLYETRNRNTLGRFLGEQILIAETGHGAPLVRCSAVIDQVVTVYTEDAWNRYKRDAWITTNSDYDWHDGTKKKVLYHLTDVHPVAPFRLPSSCRRHGRVWAEFDGEFSC